MIGYSLQTIAAQLNASLLNITNEHSVNTVITGLATLKTATSSKVAFLANAKYQSQLKDTQAAAVLLRAEDAVLCNKPALIVENPYLAFAQLSHLFEYQTDLNDPLFDRSKVVIHSTAQVSALAKIAPWVTIGAHCIIKDNVSLGTGVVIADYVLIEENTLVEPQVVIGHHCSIGKNVRLHAGSKIGSDGFGFAPTPQGKWQRIAQLGSVIIGDDCRIGANTTIDRGALDDTILGKNVIIDNQVQIAHNVVIGDHTAIASGAAIAGSTTIGKHCIIGGATGIAGHLTIADHVQLTGMSMVTKSIVQAGSYSSGTGLFPSYDWRKMVVGLRSLSDQMKLTKQLQKQLTEQHPQHLKNARFSPLFPS